MKIFQRVLHGLVVTAFGAGLYALVRITSFLVFLRHFYQTMQVGPDAVQEVLGWAKYFTWGYWIFAIILLGLGVYAVVKKLNWRILLSGLLIVSGGILYLRWDGEAPLQDRLAPRTTTADAGFRVALWLVKDSEFSRLGEKGILPVSAAELRLPAERKDWPEHVRKHREEIMLAWEQDVLVREWTDAINATPPVGVWPQEGSDPMLSFQPIRASVCVRAARAYALALDGQRDEAACSLLPMISAWYHIQQTGPNPVNEMIANVALKQAYSVLEEILKLGSLSAETRTSLGAVLRQAPEVRLVFRNLFLGEYYSMARAVDTGLEGGLQEMLKQDKQNGNWMDLIGPNLIGSANQTKRQLMKHLEQSSQLASTRQLEQLSEIGKAQSSFWQIKNPAGISLLDMAKVNYAKVADNIWKVEDQRVALLQQLEKP